MPIEYDVLAEALSVLRYSPLTPAEPPSIRLARAILYTEADADMYLHDGMGRWTILVMGYLSSRHARILCCMSGAYLDQIYPLALARAIREI